MPFAQLTQRQCHAHAWGHAVCYFDDGQAKRNQHIGTQADTDPAVCLELQALTEAKRSSAFLLSLITVPSLAEKDTSSSKVVCSH